MISTQVEIAELGAANDFNEGGTASLGAARMASQGGEVKMAQVRTASVDLVAREVFGADATIDFLKIDVEGVEIPALRSALELLGRGGVREASVEFGPAKRWAESETHGVAGANPAAAVDVLHKIDAAGYDAYLTWGRFCVPPLNATGDLADEAFARLSLAGARERSGEQTAKAFRTARESAKRMTLFQLRKVKLAMSRAEEEE